MTYSRELPHEIDVTLKNDEAYIHSSAGVVICALTPEAGTSDDLITVSSRIRSQVIYFKPASGCTITVKNTGNIKATGAGGTALIMDGQYDDFSGVWDGTYFRQTGRNNNPA